MPTSEPVVQYCSDVDELPPSGVFSEWIECVESLLKQTLLDKLTGREILVRIVDREEMRSLNAEWRKKDSATNVLAFPFDSEVSATHIPLGDIVICAPIVAAEAQEQGKPFVDRMAHMFVHGLLHLLGYDHQTDRQAAEMENIEREALSRLGYAQPYELD